ncbi:MAG: hypothetical protein LBQ81_12235 [Zoogloeaceae bacterium]|nr:hypothetical protein [Zoogloeaceae bacterium]
MQNVIHIHRAPRVFHGIYRRRLSAANEAIRQLRALGVKVLSVDIPASGDCAALVVDKNPHCRVAADVADAALHITVHRAGE